MDVYRGVSYAQRRFSDLLLYISMFPQLVAGPIVRYQTVAEEIQDRRVSAQDFADGSYRFLIGLGKKVIIANQLSEISGQFLADGLNSLSTAGAWVGIIAFTLQIYFDFSGYSDMAIGMGRCLGFHFNENFRSPYKSASVTEFWHRWHISLSTWLRDYLYISLGGNRRGKFRQYLNLVVTMFLGGLWHGASWNFVFWGMLHGVALALHKAWMQLSGRPKGWQSRGGRRVLGVVLTFHFVCFCWVFFRQASFADAVAMLGQIATSFHPELFPQLLAGYPAVFLLMALGFVLHFLPDTWEQWGIKKVTALPLAGKAALLVSLVYLVIQVKSADVQPFIYFQF